MTDHEYKAHKFFSTIGKPWLIDGGYRNGNGHGNACACADAFVVLLARTIVIHVHSVKLQYVFVDAWVWMGKKNKRIHWWSGGIITY